MTLGQWAARDADNGTASTRKTPNHEKNSNELGNDALAGGESDGGSAAQTDGSRYAGVPTTEHIEILLEAAAVSTQLPEVEQQEGDVGDSEAASRLLNRTPEDERYQDTADLVQEVQQSASSKDHERHEPHAELIVPPAEKGWHAADSEAKLTIKPPNDPRYLEALVVAEHVEGAETLLPHNRGPRERIDIAAGATKNDLDPMSEDGTIGLMTGDAEGVEAAKSLGMATQQEEDADSEDEQTIELPANARYQEMLIADHVENFEIENQLVQEASQPPHERLAHPASVVAAGTIQEQCTDERDGIDVVNDAQCHQGVLNSKHVEGLMALR